MIRLVITRFRQSEKGTLGKFELLNEKDSVLLRGSTIEREGPDTTEAGRNKRIPSGDYYTCQHESPRFKVTLPLLYNDKVPKSRYILIHWGNSIKDLEGCIALGASDNDEDFIYKSKATVLKFLDLIEDQDLTVHIESDYDGNTLDS